MLSVYGEDEMNEAGRRAIDSMVGKAKDCLKILTTDIEAFTSEVVVVLRELVALWMKAQKSYKMVIAVAESPENDDERWDSLEEFGPLQQLPEGHPPGASITLLPRIFVPDDHIVHPGIVLWPNQQAFKDAQAELKSFEDAQQRKRQEAEQRKLDSIKSKFANMLPGKSRRHPSVGSRRLISLSSPVGDGGCITALGDMEISCGEVPGANR